MNRGLLAIIVIAVVVTAAFPSLVVEIAPARERASNPYAVALIGDTPYGAVQVERFGDLIDRINADPKVRLVVHVGDIKNGSSRCDDAYFDFIAGSFDTFKDPLAYTPGDNEWTDCHRANNGAYDPQERLAALRETFFSEPGTLLGGRPMRVAAQDDYAENTLWTRSQVVFAMVHAVGSNNGLDPVPGETPAQAAARIAEVEGRIAAAVAWIDKAFDAAETREAAGLVLTMQADTERTAGEAGLAEIRERIAERAADFDGKVLLLQGDSHTYTVDRPFSPNLTRLVVEGATVDEYLRLTIDPKTDAVFRWTRETAAG